MLGTEQPISYCLMIMIDDSTVCWMYHGLVQDCSNSSALAMEILQSCSKPSICALLARCVKRTMLKRRLEVSNLLVYFVISRFVFIYQYYFIHSSCTWMPITPNTYIITAINSLRPRQNGRHFPDDIFKCNLLNENVWISIKISLKFVPKDPINYNPALVQIMAWRRPGDKPLSEPMMVRLPTHICVTRPQWVK